MRPEDGPSEPKQWKGGDTKEGVGAKKQKAEGSWFALSRTVSTVALPTAKRAHATAASHGVVDSNGDDLRDDQLPALVIDEHTNHAC
jgi:hypothetical protein